MKHLKILLLTIFALLILPNLTIPFNSTEIYLEKSSVANSKEIILKRNIASIYLYENGNILGQGSGVFVGKDKVLTAFHLDGRATNYEVKAGDKIYKATVFYSDKESDLKLLKIDGVIYWQYIKVARSNPQNLDDIYFGGFNTAKFPVLRQWYFSKIEDEKYSTWVFPVWFGDSGGPIFNKKGELISIITKIRVLSSIYGDRYTSMIGYGAKLGQIKEIMKEKVLIDTSISIKNDTILMFENRIMRKKILSIL